MVGLAVSQHSGLGRGTLASVCTSLGHVDVQRVTRLINRTRTALAVLLAGIPQPSSSQSSSIGRVGVDNLTIGLGIHGQWQQDLPIEDFRQMAPESRLLRQDFSTLTRDSWQRLEGALLLRTTIGINLLRERPERRRDSPQFSLGITYLDAVQRSAFFYRTNRWPHDTVVSSTTGEIHVIDSVEDLSFTMRYISNELLLDVCLIWRSDKKAKASLLTGVGVSVGTSVMAATEIIYYVAEYTEIRGQGPDTFNATIDSEQFRNRSNLSCSLWMPLGIEMRIGREGAALNRVYLTYSITPEMRIRRIPELRTMVTGGFQLSFGFKIALV